MNKKLDIRSVQGMINVIWHNSLHVSNEFYSFIKVKDNHGNYLPWTKGIFTQIDSYHINRKTTQLINEGFTIRYIYKKSELQSKDIKDIEKWLEETNISTDSNFKSWEFDGCIIDGLINEDRAIELNSNCRYY